MLATFRLGTLMWSHIEVSYVWLGWLGWYSVFGDAFALAMSHKDLTMYANMNKVKVGDRREGAEARTKGFQVSLSGCLGWLISG